MIVNPLDFNCYSDLAYLRQGITLKNYFKSTNNLILTIDHGLGNEENESDFEYDEDYPE